MQDMTTSPLLKTAAGKQWDHIGTTHHHGINIPLFSLHSSRSCGIGEYPDIMPLIIWCRSIGFDTIQLLPLNDTGPETSPYSALSAYALNPIHISPVRLPYALQDATLKQYVTDMQALNRKSQRIDYKTVQDKKDLFFRRYYNIFGKALTNRSAFVQFKKNNAFWLKEYAAFKALKVLHNWQSWESWPPQYKDPTDQLLNQPPPEIQEEADYQTFLQYLCFTQFNDVKKHAEDQHIHLKGDVPILINRESADVWFHRDLFLLDFAAGAPPDMYNHEGQKWGFPLYNWKTMAAQKYTWWISRLNVAAKLYHIYRIDHIVGFFRIWGIPLPNLAKDGQFIPQDQNTWIPLGTSIMKVMLENCPMLPIGEDLGTVPPEVRLCLKNMGISGTKVMRWERRWEEDKGFIDPKDYPEASMTTLSTHDSETLDQWWKERPEESTLYAQTMGWQYTPELAQEQRLAILKDSHNSASLFHINLLPEYLALVPDMTWPTPADERINIPGVILDTNWTYRMRPSVEEIIGNPTLKRYMTEILRDV